MAINKKLIHFKKYETFNGSQGINGATEPTNGMYGNIPEHSIVFILDAKKIWTHGQLYDCDLSALEEIGLIKELIELIQDTLAADKFKEYDKEYLTFTALEDSSIGYEMPMWASEDELPILDLQYSYDGITWTNFDGTTLSITAGNFVKFKGDNTEFHRNIGTFIINGKVDASGNVMSIVYADNFIGKIDFPNEEFNLSNLFGYYCLGLYSAHNLILPALNLTYQCYYEMFTECTSLISTPELPATTLLEECYCGMFSACTSLTIAPLLPSLKLAPYCYSGMFYNCNSLVSTPELPATMLATSCYSGMFNKCSSLVNAPSLPAIVLANSCYEEMFYECTALLNTPELPATILADKCYNMMFYGCTSLTNICELPAKKLENSCYQGMFGMCTSLTEIPELHAKTLVYNCYTGMFLGCDNVTYAKMLCDMPSTDELTWACSGMFSAPSGTIVLSSVAQSHPDIVPRGWKVINYYVNNEYISELKDKINSSNKTIQSNTEEIDILKNRIISTTYSELKDAVTNSTLTTGQYYRITDYVTTCNGTSAKVEDASTIDPANPVDGQSRSAGHLFDIIVRALSPNQLDENAVAMRHEGDTYYPEDFDGTVIKYFIENKEFSAEDGKGTIFYMKDHNNNECPYDFTNVQYYSTNENIETGWYYTFSTGVDSYYTRAHDNLITPTEFHELPNIILITPEATPMTMYDNHITLDSYNLLISGLGILSNKISSTLNINLIAKGVILTNNIYLLLTSNFITAKYISSNYIFSCSNILCNCTNYISSNLWYKCKTFTLNCGAVLNNNFLLGTTNVTVNGGDCVYTTTSEYCKNITACSLYYMTFETATNIQITAINGEYPKFCRVGVNTTCSNITISGGILATTISGRYLNIIGSDTSVSSVHNTIHEVRGASDASRLTLTLNNSGPHKKDIYSDISGRIFYTWEDNGIKKGYYINNNTDTEWKEYSEDVNFITSDERDKLNNSVQSVDVIGGQEYITIDVNRGEFNDVEADIVLNVSTDISANTETGLYLADAAAVKNYVSTNYISNEGGTISGNLYAGSSILYEEGGIDLVSGSIEASEVNDFSYVQDSQGNNLLEVLDAKAETYTITDFSAYDIDSIYRGSYTLTIDPNPLEDAIRNNKVILIQHELGMGASPVLDAYIEDLIYLTVMYDSCIYLVFIELDLTVLTSASIDCIYNKTDLITDSVTISNAMTITKDADDYAHLNISEGLIVDNIIEWKDGSDTTASINYNGSASFSDLTVAGKNVTSFLTHHNSNINVVTSLSNVPTNKAVVFAHVGTSQELVFDSSNLVSGRGVHVFIYNNSSTTPITIIPLLDGSTFLCDNVTEFEIPRQSIAEVSMVYLNSSLSGSLKFIRSITV